MDKGGSAQILLFLLVSLSLFMGAGVRAFKDDTDCHMRNMDLCYAPLLGSLQKMLPRSDDEIQKQCDEIDGAIECAMEYNEKCSSMNSFGGLIAPNSLRDVLPPGYNFCSNATVEDRAYRKRVKDLAPCVNDRVPQIKKCVVDLQTALMVIYEPGKPFPNFPLCCSFTRFRKCAVAAIDEQCGVGSFKEFESIMMSTMPKVLTRACKSNKAKNKNEQCEDVLPPIGTPVPKKPGKFMSRLSKILGMFAATQ